MPSSKEYLNYILDQLSGLQNINYKIMMGEYMIYYNDKLTAYICDNRLLLKSVDELHTIMNDYILEKPYPGAKNMVIVDDIDDKEYLETLFNFVWCKLPFPKKKK